MLWVNEAWVNATKDYRIGESGVYETCYEDKGKLYRAMVREYGRCTGHVYIDPDAKVVGWVFLKRKEYEDTHETYLAETWVTVHTAPDTVTRTAHYA
jgi:hypothetical protein